MERYRNADGTYNGVGVMSDLTGLAPGEITSLFEQVKANAKRLDACPRHEFEPMAQAASTARKRYRCKHCGGEVDSHAHRWHEIGRKSGV